VQPLFFCIYYDAVARCEIVFVDHFGDVVHCGIGLFGWFVWSLCFLSYQNRDFVVVGGAAAAVMRLFVAHTDVAHVAIASAVATRHHFVQTSAVLSAWFRACLPDPLVFQSHWLGLGTTGLPKVDILLVPPWHCSVVWHTGVLWR